MKKLVYVLMILLTVLHAEDKSAKVVYDLTTKELSNFELRILNATVKNKSYYEAQLRELDVAVIIHGGAYRFFLKAPQKSEYKDNQALIANYQDLAKRIKTLSETYDVEFLLCGVGAQKHHIEQKDLYDFVKIIPNASIGLIDKQNAGYAYVPVRD
jgi:intracellular sulfur oxidation DsrE/DsrF family protein